jgi:hypothetical protein
MFPSININYIPDPMAKDANGQPVLYPQNDPHYSAIQQYYNNKAQYATIDQKTAQLAQQSWNQWAVGAVIAKDAGQYSTYVASRPAPVAQHGHTVTWNGSAGVIADSGQPVWSPDPNWNVNDWETSQTGTGENLVKINDPARNKQNSGGFAGSTAGSAPNAAPAPDVTALLQQLLAALAQQQIPKAA